METGNRNKILIHACCACCSSIVLERLQSEYEPIAYFYNPNIQPADEYRRRLGAFYVLCDCMDIHGIEGPYDRESWLAEVRGYEEDAEGGLRCLRCYAQRLSRVAEKAASMGIQTIATTLTVSPHKKPEMVNSAGSIAAARFNLSFLAEDFKKQGGFQRSIAMSQKYDLYRQNYCGCRPRNELNAT
jgi:predicted adenine nucleotide alpha hydrolase (AANH) superfamily ATPase